MDEAVGMTTIDSETLPEGTADRPLVTFALFAYNQEKYIREAVEGAFSQTYEPLEIILSDDCSSDRTYEIMQEMAEGYRGSHRVRLRRSEVNRGLGIHIRYVVEIARGYLIVVAAGDDVSLPHRTISLVELIEDENSLFAASNYNTMHDNGELTGENIQNDYTGNYLWSITDADPKHFANGAAAAYRRDFLQAALYAARKAIETGNLYNEDILFAAFAVAVSQLPSEYTSGALINYRINPLSLSNFRVQNATIGAEILLIERESFRARSRLACLQAVNEIAESYPELDKKLRRKLIRSDMRLSLIEIAACSPRFLTRLPQLAKAKTLKELRIFLARLFGVRALATARVLKRRIKANLASEVSHEEG